MEYEGNIYQTINPVATLDLCGAGNFGNGVHIDIGAGIFSTRGQELFQGRALAEARLGTCICYPHVSYTSSFPYSLIYPQQNLPTTQIFSHMLYGCRGCWGWVGLVSRGR